MSNISIYDFVEKVRIMVEIELTVETEVMTTHKQNGIELVGIMIKNPEANISPVLYLNNFYEYYLGTRDIDKVVNYVVEIYKNERLSGDFDIEWFSDYENIHKGIYYLLLNYDDNTKYLENKVYEKYLDLVKVYFVAFENNELEGGQVFVTEGLLKLWGITKEELQEQAEHNLKDKEILIEGINDVLKELFNITGEEPETEPDIIESLMYVVQYNDYKFGSVLLCNKDRIREFAEEKESDLFIIPSSIFEVILMVMKGSELYEDEETITYLKEMVYGVNRQVVLDEERLSDSVYLYKRSTDTIEVL